MALAMRGGGGPYSPMDEALKDYGVEVHNLRDDLFRSVEQFLHFFDINLRRRIMLTLHQPHNRPTCPMISAMLCMST